MAEAITAAEEETTLISPLFLTTIESYYLFEHLRGWTNDNYLEFYPSQRLRQVHSTGKRPGIEERQKQLGMTYNGMLKLPAKMGSELYHAISENRAAGCGTEITIELDDKGEIGAITPKSTRSFDF